MARRITVGIDIGTYQIKVVVAAESETRQHPVILGTGIATSKGLRHGYIINPNDIRKSLKSALLQAEKASGISIRKAYLSIGGVGLEEIRSRAEIAIVRGDMEVTDQDVNAVLEEGERRISQRVLNRKVIHVIPLHFRLDGQTVLGHVHGMRGTKLEVETLFITTLEQHLQDLIAAVEDLGVSVIDVMASPIAASFVTLTKAQKIAGCILANIGAETLSIVIFENNLPISLKIFPIGSTDITNDIALGLQVSLDDAEKIKRTTPLDIAQPKKQLDQIVQNKLNDMFALIEAHLRKIGKNGLLPAGIIITGGGSGIATIEDIARGALKLPSKKATMYGVDQTKFKDSSWAVAYGLCIWGMSNDEESIGVSLAKQTSNKFYSTDIGVYHMVDCIHS